MLLWAISADNAPFPQSMVKETLEDFCFERLKPPSYRMSDPRTEPFSGLLSKTTFEVNRTGRPLHKNKTKKMKGKEPSSQGTQAKQPSCTSC